MLLWKQRFIEHKQEEVFLEKNTAASATIVAAHMGKLTVRMFILLDIPSAYELEIKDQKLNFIPNICSINKLRHIANSFRTLKIYLSSPSPEEITDHSSQLPSGNRGNHTNYFKTASPLKNISISFTLMQNTNSVFCEIVLFVSYFHWLAIPVKERGNRKLIKSSLAPCSWETWKPQLIAWLTWTGQE